LMESGMRATVHDSVGNQFGMRLGPLVPLERSVCTVPFHGFRQRCASVMFVELGSGTSPWLLNLHRP
jgi:hypothetical protein